MAKNAYKLRDKISILQIISHVVVFKYECIVDPYVIETRHFVLYSPVNRDVGG